MYLNCITVKEIITEKLIAIERDFNVRILYACESGSRAWGFASPDSDYDVRFIYVHTVTDYLSIDEHRDVIELPVDKVLDISGWELRKALRLFNKSNAPLFEWLQSPIVYSADAKFLSELKSIMNGHFSPRASMHHYLSMATGVFERDLTSDRVNVKRYFYALRPVLAAKWIADRNTVPPMELVALRVLLPRRIDMLVDELLALKVTVDESFMMERHGELNAFIEECIRYCEARVPLKASGGERSELNGLFKKFIS